MLFSCVNTKNDFLPRPQFLPSIAESFIYIFRHSSLSAAPELPFLSLRCSLLCCFLLGKDFSIINLNLISYLADAAVLYWLHNFCPKHHLISCKTRPHFISWESHSLNDIRHCRQRDWELSQVKDEWQFELSIFPSIRRWRLDVSWTYKIYFISKLGEKRSRSVWKFYFFVSCLRLMRLSDLTSN